MDKRNAQEKFEEVKAVSELTAVRMYAYLCRFWNGDDVPSLNSLFDDQEQGSTSNFYERNGQKYQRIDGVEFQVVE